MATTDFCLTGPALAREAGVAPATVKLYSDLGLIDYRAASNGVRLYAATSAPRVRVILAERLARRGGNRRSA